jgi:formylglycine-generating enzyme required for sulfatase activity
MIKRQFLLLSILATSGLSAGIVWVDDHEPNFHDESYEPQKESFLQEDEEGFDLSDMLLEDTLDTHLTSNDIELVETPYEGGIELTDFFHDPSNHTFVDVDFDLEEAHPNDSSKHTNTKDEIQFVIKETEKQEDHFTLAEADFDVEDVTPENGASKKANTKDNIEFVLKEATPNVSEEENSKELALAESNTHHTQLVPIAEVGPFSEFTIQGKGVKSPLVEKVENDNEDNQMVYFAPSENTQCGFYLSTKKVSNGEYEVFVKATHHRPPPHWLGGNIPSGQENTPVVNVTYKDAFLYSIWAGKRLPKDSELVIAVKAAKIQVEDGNLIGEWTSTPSYGKNATARGASHLTMNSELSRITYHKVFLGDPEGVMPAKESNSYNNNTGFRTAINVN